MIIEKMLARRGPVSFLWIALLGVLLGSCASSAVPADIENLVRVFNVYQTGGEALPREVEDCEYLGSVSASAPTSQGGSMVFTDPKILLETIRSRAYRKGADTAFVSVEPRLLQYNESTLRATVFRCGDSMGPQKVGSPIRRDPIGTSPPGLAS